MFFGCTHYDTSAEHLMVIQKLSMAVSFFLLFIFAFICLFALLLTSEFSPPTPAVPFSKLKFREICTFDRLQMESSIISHLYHHLLFSIVYLHYLLFARLLV